MQTEVSTPPEYASTTFLARLIAIYILNLTNFVLCTQLRSILVRNSTDLDILFLLKLAVSQKTCCEKSATVGYGNCGDGEKRCFLVL